MSHCSQAAEVGNRRLACQPHKKMRDDLIQAGQHVTAPVLRLSLAVVNLERTEWYWVVVAVAPTTGTLRFDSA